MSSNRQRAKSHSSMKSSNLSVSGPNKIIKPIKTVVEEEFSNSDGMVIPKIIKVLHSPKIPTTKNKKQGNDSSDDLDVDSAHLLEEDDEDFRDFEEGSIPSIKFNLFSPRKKSSPRPITTSNPSPRNGSPRTNSRSSSPRLLKSSNSPNSSPRLAEINEFSPFGDSPVDKKDAIFLYESAKHKIVHPDNENIKNIGMIYSHASKNKHGTLRKYDVVITGSGATGLGSMIYLLDRSNKFGEGASAQVCSAYDLQTGMELAAKIFKESSAFVMINAEIQALTKLGIFFGGYNLSRFSKDERIVFTKKYPGETLLKILYELQYKDNEIEFISKNTHEIPLTLKIISGVLNAVANTHQKNLIHRDIKLANFLCQIVAFNSVEVNLIDFDSAIADTVKTCRIASSFGYLAPEHTTDEPTHYQYSSDYFSTGIVIWEIISKINYQQLLSQKDADIILKEKWHRHLKREEFSEMMSDLNNVQIDPDPKNISSYIFKTKIEPQIYLLISSLINESADARLYGSSLKEEANKIDQLVIFYENLFNVVSTLCYSLNTLQILGIPLELLKTVTEKIDLLQEKDLLVFATAALDQATYTTSAEKCIEDSLKRLTESFKALKSYVIGVKEAQKYKTHITQAFMAPLLKAHTKDPKESLSLLEAVSVLNFPLISSPRLRK